MQHELNRSYYRYFAVKTMQIGSSQQQSVTKAASTPAPMSKQHCRMLH